jgi:hypothetical protein
MILRTLSWFTLLAATYGLVAQGAVAASYVPDPVIDQHTLALFDKPMRFVRHVLPAAQDTSGPAGVVRCYDFPTFRVKELDNGQHGDDAISVTPLASAAVHPACGAQNDTGERVVKGGQSGYFIGAKGGFVYVMSTLGLDLTPFMIVSAATGRAIYADSSVDLGPQAVSLQDDVLTLTYRRGLAGTCSIITGGEGCWRTLAQQSHLAKAVAARPAPVEACKAAYGKTDPTDASVVSYPVVVSISLSGRATVRSRGALACAPAA